MYQLIMVRVTEIYCWMKWFAQDTRHLSGIANIWAGTTITACIKRMWELIVFRRVFDYISNKFAKIFIFLIIYSEKKQAMEKDVTYSPNCNSQQENPNPNPDTPLPPKFQVFCIFKAIEWSSIM